MVRRRSARALGASTLDESTIPTIPWHGAAIVIEVWAIPKEGVGAFMAGVPSPLAIGTLETQEGLHVHGFLCEPWALVGARDITSYGGWAAYLANQAPTSA